MIQQVPKFSFSNSLGAQFDTDNGVPTAVLEKKLIFTLRTCIPIFTPVVHSLVYQGESEGMSPQARTNREELVALSCQ